jgi:adenylate cyclase
MANEVERKFLVKGEFAPFAHKKTRIIQGYLSSVPERTVRVRVKGDKGFLTIKGIGGASGASRFEWERELPLPEAEALLRLCEPGIIDKTRYRVAAGARAFEVDEFHGDNEGLLLAEIELAREDETFARPDWLGREVTGDERYYNSRLARHPFTCW